MNFKGIWQYKLSLSCLKEHPKLYINFVYNHSVSCLVFETNLYWSKAACIPPSWICIRYAYVTSRVKSEIFILQTTCHYQYETWFSEAFLVLNELTTLYETFRRNLVPHEEVLTSLPCLLKSSKTQLPDSLLKLRFSAFPCTNVRKVCLTHWATMRPTYFFYLSNTRRFYSSMSKLCSLMG